MTKDSPKTTADQALIPEDLEVVRGEILRNKKNFTALILAFACEEIGDVGDAVQYLRNRLYGDDGDVFQIFATLLRKKSKIRKALKGGD